MELLLLYELVVVVVVVVRDSQKILHTHTHTHTNNNTNTRWMINDGYGDARTLERRIAAMEAWLEVRPLMEADPDAKYVYCPTHACNNNRVPSSSNNRVGP